MLAANSLAIDLAVAEEALQEKRPQRYLIQILYFYFLSPQESGMTYPWTIGHAVLDPY